MSQDEENLPVMVITDEMIIVDLYKAALGMV